MRRERFFKNQELDFVELRYSQGSALAFKPHMHPTFSIGGVKKGKVSYEVDGQKAILAPGALVIINPETLHVCNPATEAERSYYMLHLDIEWCFQVQQSMWEVSYFIPANTTRVDDIDLYDQYCRTMACLIDEKIHLQEKEQMMFELGEAVFSVVCSPQPVKTKFAGDTETLKHILRTDLHKDFTINGLAKKMDANPYTLIRQFKAVTGITPHAFRMSCRIEKARELLREGKDIAQTALECGFFDQSHFHRHFKAMTTVTPQAYQVNFIQ